MSEILHHGYPCPMSDEQITEALWKLGGYSPEGCAVQQTITHLRAENERLREALRASVVAMKRWSAEEDGLPEAPIGAHEAVTASEAILGYVWAGCGPDPLRAAAEKKEGERGK